MISIYHIKPQFQRLLQPILQFLHQRGVTANQITVAALFLSLGIALLFYFGDYSSWFFLALPLGLLIRMALNALDGMMARSYNQTTPTGEILNEFGDTLSDLMISLPLLKFFPQATWAIVLFIAMSILNEFAGVLGKVVSGIRRYDGPMGKSDRAFIIGVIGILLACGVHPHGWILVCFIVLDALLGVSTFLRITRSLHAC